MKWHQAMWKETPTYTFFNLPYTILANFDELTWAALTEETRLFMPHMPPLFYISTGKDSTLETDFRQPTEGYFENNYSASTEEMELRKAWVRNEDLGQLESIPGPIVSISRNYGGTTTIIYWVRSSAVQYPVNFRLQAVQYRQDELRLGLIDYTDLSPINYLKSWIEWGWGKSAAEPLTINRVPPVAPRTLTNDSPPPLLENRAKAEDWFAWFDWYYSQSWGTVPNKLEHMARLCAKSLSRVSDMHALYMSDRR